MACYRHQYRIDTKATRRCFDQADSADLRTGGKSVVWLPEASRR